MLISWQKKWREFVAREQLNGETVNLKFTAISRLNNFELSKVLKTFLALFCSWVKRKTKQENTNPPQSVQEIVYVTRTRSWNGRICLFQEKTVFIHSFTDITFAGLSGYSWVVFKLYMHTVYYSFRHRNHDRYKLRFQTVCHTERS